MKIQPETQELIDIARAYRRENTHIPNGGYFIVTRQGAGGWTASLESNASSHMAGTWAIDESGNKYLAIGGNDYDGAEAWQVIPHDSFETVEE